jgi:hypothetical protein
MLHPVLSTAFKDVRKTDYVTFDVRKRILNRISDPSLSGEVHNPLRSVSTENVFNGFSISQIDAEVGIVGMTGVTSQPGLLD